MNRRKCRERGHRFGGIEGVLIPYEFCTRWFCRASRVAPWVPPEFAVELRKGIPEDRR